jgi:hypothetical protein
MSEFAIDPCNTSRPNEIVIAQIPKGGTLREMIDYVERKAREFEQSPRYEVDRKLAPHRDELNVPSMNWEIDWEFSELKDAPILSGELAGLSIERALQRIRFRLDKSGAELASEALVEYKSDEPRHVHFDEPFLVYMKRRDRGQPFFAAWIENADLLKKQSD